jgi:hypothetical protein
MTLDRAFCAICAWRGDCNKKFKQGSGVHCPDYTRDLTIRERASEEVEVKEPAGKKKISEIRIL